MCLERSESEIFVISIDHKYNMSVKALNYTVRANRGTFFNVEEFFHELFLLLRTLYVRACMREYCVCGLEITARGLHGARGNGRRNMM